MPPNRSVAVLSSLSNSDLEKVRVEFTPVTAEAKLTREDGSVKLIREDGSVKDDEKRRQREARTGVARPKEGDDSYWDWPSDAPTAHATDASGSSSSASFNDDYWSKDACGVDQVDVMYHIDYSSAGELGVGTKTTVRKAYDQKVGKAFAVKSVRKVHVEEYNAMKREAAILALLGSDEASGSCPYIIKYNHVVEERNSFHMLLEMCHGSELYGYVANLAQKDQTMPERHAILYAQQILRALSYLHQRGIVHRDVKLENLVHKHRNYYKNNEIRLIDFGLATRMTGGEGSYLTEKVGSPQYVAPEVLNERYTEKCDIWSVGVVAYALLSAEAPFLGASNTETYYKIQNSDVSFHQVAWEKVSNEAKDFIRSCLEKDPSARPSADQLLAHEWFHQQRLSVDGGRPASTGTDSNKKRKPKFLSKVSRLFGK